MNKRLDAIQGLRGMAILMIFYSHLPIFSYENSGLGAVGVSIFIKISGFIIAYSYYKREYNKAYTIKESFKYCKKQLIKFYPLHIVTFLFALLLDIRSFLITGYNSAAIITEMKRAIANVLLLQSYVPSKTSLYYFSFNMVSWYLSVCLIFYFVTPIIVRVAKRLSKEKKIVFIILLFIVQCVFSWGVKDNPYEKWLIYINPFFRLLEFMEAFMIGCIYVEKNGECKKESTSSIMCSILQIIIFFVFVISCIIYFQIPPVYARGVFYGPITMALVYICTGSRGVFPQIMSNKVLVYIGNISFEIMMIHQLVVRYAKIAVLPNWITVCVVFIICIVWKYIFQSRNKCKNN